MEWLGLWPISLRKFGLAVAGFVSILGWNWLRVNFLATSVNGAAFAEPDLLVWSFIGVFVEELLFRGVVQTQIAETYSALTAILITSVLFLAIHVPGWIILSIPVNAATVATVFLVGLICGAVRQWSKSLWPGVAIHWSNNLGA